MLEAKICLALTDQISVLSVSESIEDLLGFSVDDFISARVSLKDLIHPHDIDISEVLFSRGSHHTPGPFNIRIRQANGRIRCIRGFCEKRSGDNGVDVTLDLLLQDAKSLKRTLDDAVSVPNFRAIMDNTNDYIYFKDRNHVFTGASQTLVSLCHPAEHWSDLIGQTDYDVFPEEYADIYYRLEKQVFAGALVAHEIQKTLTNDGESGWVDNRKYPIKNENGEIIGLYGIARDITERKQMEENLIESEYKFRSLFEEMTEGVALHSVIRDDFGTILNYRIEMVNPAYTDILGLSPEEVTGKIATEVYGSDTPPYLKEFSEVVQARKSSRFTTFYQHMDKYFDISVIPWESGGFATIFLDITSRIKAEEFKRQQTEQLQQSQRLESLGVLAGGIAHDFNNILAIIMGNCSLAQMDPDGAGEYLLQIEKAAERAAGLCRQMLTYAGKAQSVQSQVDIKALVDDVVMMVKSAIRQNVVIKHHLSAEIPPIKGDASQLSQVALNLIINAAEAIGEAQGVVQVSLAKTGIEAGQSEKDYLGKIIPPGWYACLEVTDNGCGMSDEIYNRVFEPFYTTKFTGRGLGMSAVLGIITAQGGAIQIFSRQGKGTTFKVYFLIQIGDSGGDETLNQSALAGC